MQAALAFPVGFDRADIVRRGFLCDGPDSVHFSFGRDRQIRYKDMTFARFVPEKAASCRRRRSGAVELQIAGGWIS